MQLLHVCQLNDAVRGGLRQAPGQRSSPLPCPPGAGTRKRVLSPSRQRPASAAAIKRSCVSPTSEAALAKAATGVKAGAGSSVQMSAASAAEQTLLPHLPLTILRNGATMEVAVQVLLRLRASCRHHVKPASAAGLVAAHTCKAAAVCMCNSTDVQRAAPACGPPCSKRRCECAWLQVGLEAGQGTTRLVHWCGAQLQASMTVSCWNMGDCGRPPTPPWHPFACCAAGATSGCQGCRLPARGWAWHLCVAVAPRLTSPQARQAQLLEEHLAA